MAVAAPHAGYKLITGSGAPRFLTAREVPTPGVYRATLSDGRLVLTPRWEDDDGR